MLIMLTFTNTLPIEKIENLCSMTSTLTKNEKRKTKDENVDRKRTEEGRNKQRVC